MDSQSEPETRSEGACQSSEPLTQANWQARYDEGKTGWDRGQPNPMLAQWIDRGDLRPCSVLVPGCGRGHEVIALASLGFNVTAVDFADSAVQALERELRQRNLQAKVIQSDLFAFDPSESFDAIYEQTCLCAVHPSQWEAYHASLLHWLRPGGNLFALFMQTEATQGPPFSCDLSKMQRLFRSDAWQWSTEKHRVDHPMGLHELACVLTRL
ncbi:MAG TPA: thiopurine S-methyltransferase [Planctomycetaceae bacterium]|nr:thiopurine S-methyltransferase [Planctomycetaceae bacterium]